MSRMIIIAVVALVSVTTLNGAEPAAPASATTTPDVPSLKEQIAQLRALQEVVKSRLLGVPEEEQKRLAEFLKSPDTGLIKLLPRDKYEDVVVGLRGGGAYYSFVRLTHEYGYGSDIELQNGRLTCGFAGGDYGYFLDLGDVSIEKAAAANATAPEWLPDGADRRWRDIWEEKSVGKDVLWEQRSRAFQRGEMEPRGAVAKAGKTYLLRSVSPERSDILVAIRVERAFMDDDSILLSWKLLKKFPVANPRGRQLPPFNANQGGAKQRP